MKKCAVTIEAMAAANFSRDVVLAPAILTVDVFNRMRDSLEDKNTASGDLIDFETVLENPPLAQVGNQDFGVYQPLGKQKLYNHCDWLKIGNNERCGKRCKQFYCKTHSEYMNKGGKIPLPCLCCGVGVMSSNQLCKSCETKYGVEYK